MKAIAFDVVVHDVDRRLSRILPRASASPAPLARAMRYAVLGGGKRVRPYLTLAAAALTGAPRDDALSAAAAIELVHAFSLVHDDLPALDDDDERRGRPSLHRAFGEGVALLAGDALLALAFESLAALADRPRIGPKRSARMVNELASAVGFHGLVGGETADILGADRDLAPAAVRAIHTRKTARLFAAAARVGGHAGGAPRATITLLGSYGMALGEAFQIADDVRDEHERRGRDRTKSPDRTDSPRRAAPSLVAAAGRREAQRRGRRVLGLARGVARRLDREPASFLALADLVEDRLG